jgi:hypothetical protein
MMRHTWSAAGLALALLPAGADACGVNLWQVIGSGLAVGQARKGWDETDPNMKACLTNGYRVDIPQLIEHGIGPDDQRLRPYVTGCNQAMAAAREKREQAQEAQAQSERAAEEQLQAQRAAEAAEKAAAQKRMSELTARYGQQKAAAIANHTVSLGMTKDEVLAARGAPNSRQIVPPSDELWKYGTDQVVLTNGRVSYVGH